MDRTPLNEHCSAVLIKKLPEKLGDPDKFLILCDFLEMDECLALADLGANINLMPLSVWKKISLPELTPTPTCMTLELADRTISQAIGIAEDVYVKVGKRSFLKTGRALIDVYEGELTLRVGKEDVTFNLDQTSRYSSTYDDMTANRIDVIEMACKEYSPEVLGFFDVIASGNPTPYNDPIISTSSLTLTPFEDSDFLLEEVDAFLALEDDPTSPEVDHSYYDLEGDILLLEAFLNDDPSLPPPTQGNLKYQILSPLLLPRREKANDQIEKFYEIFKDLSFEISLTDALILMPKFASTLKALIGNKEKLSEMARTPLNEHCSAVILNKLPEKLGDPGKFLIPCDFPGMDECLALADLGASINLMPLSVWKKLSLPELTPTCMTLELADRSITQPIGIAEDVYLKVGKFKFPADFVVVDFDADPRVPLILGRSFLKTGRALIDVYEGELTLRVGKEAVTFNLDQTSRYSSNYDDMTANRIDVIEMACEDDFLLEEVDAFLALEDDLTSPEVDDSYYDPEGDILLLESFLNDDPSLPPPTQGNYLPEIQKELKVCEAKNDKSSIDEPPEVKLKDLPPHLEYAFLEGNDKLPVIIAKDLSVEEKAALIKVLKSHKRAIAWKLSDIKGINPEFCTHKILIEEDYKPAVQRHRRLNPKIHDVIKKEVEKLFDAGLIYPISDSPWVSPVHCVPKKGGFTVVENDENELNERTPS
ncbi:reverse transcriptase domain-containing protein [Tanacetum coccineum]|uniref:Reverse transcriptase domain-containing protein n=1 Tax=Tanacetum coccineum TaxID=301880 RepID=A0ABQ5HEL4_9ASTR